MRQQDHQQVSEVRAKLLSVSVFAREVGISPMSVYRLVQAGDLPSVRFGKRIFVPSSAIDQLEAAALASGGTVTAAELFGGAS